MKTTTNNTRKMFVVCDIIRHIVILYRLVQQLKLDINQPTGINFEDQQNQIHQCLG